MDMPDQEAPQNRRKKSIWLMAAGAVSLLIPLAGVIYLHLSQNAGAAGPSGRNDVFERRDGEDRNIIPTQTAVVTPPPAAPGAGAAGKGGGSSLDFIKSSADLQARVTAPKAAAAGSVPAASTAPAAPPAVAAVAAKTGVKPGKKPFVMPKLKPSRGFTNFGSTGQKGGAAAGGQGTTADFMKNLPPGAANDPQVQQYLKSQQGK